MASKSVEYIIFLRDKFSPQLNQINKSLQQTGQRISRVGQNMTLFITLPLLAAGGAAVKLASDFEETQSKFDVVFGSLQKQANETAENFAQNFGLSELASKQLLSATGDLLTGFGFSQKAAFDLSSQVNILAADLASFTNLEGGTERASEALTKALLGETESAKSLGIVIRQNTKEFRNSVAAIQKAQGVTVQQAKAIKILEIATTQSKNALGDFARTQGSFANQTRIAKARLEDLAVEMGTILLPVALKLLVIVKGWIDSFSALSTSTKKMILVIAGIAAAMGPLLFIIGKIIAILPVLGSAIAVLTGPIGLVIAAVVIAAVLIIRNWDKIVAYFKTGKGSKTWEKFAASALKLWESLKVAFKELVDFLIVAWDKWLPVLEFQMKLIIDLFTLVFDQIANWLDLFTALFKGNWTRFAKELLQIITLGFADPIIEVFRKAIVGILETVAQLDALKGDFFGERRVFPEIFEEGSLENAISRVNELAGILTSVDKIAGSVAGKLAGSVGGRPKGQKPGAPGATGVASSSATTPGGGITTIKSAAPRVFNINIENLVEGGVNINAANIEQGMEQVKKIVTEALLGGLSDTQNLAR